MATRGRQADAARWWGSALSRPGICHVGDPSSPPAATAQNRPALPLPARRLGGG